MTREAGALARDLPAQGAPAYLPQLDGVRGIAVLSVITFHLLQPLWTPGWIGVHVFFALSGYLITTLLIRELRSSGTVDLPRFFLRRLLRLYPPLIVALVVLAPIGLIASRSAKWYLVDTAVAATYTTNVFTTITGHWADGWSHTWSLAMEEQFYLVWPLLLLALSRFGRRRAVLVAMLGAAGVSFAGYIATFVPQGATFSPFWNCGGLLLGCLLALTRDRWERFAHRDAWAATGMALLVVALLLGSVEAVSAWAPLVASLATVVVVSHLAVNGRLSTPLSIPPLVRIGRISYELYLWHYPLVIAVNVVLPGSVALRLGIVLVGSFLGASLSHRFVSEPVNRWLKPKLLSRGAASAVPAHPPALAAGQA